LSKIFSAGTRTEENRPKHHAYSYDFLIEVLCSYRLIFGQNKNSFSKFRQIQPDLFTDPLLQKLCGNASIEHNFYGEYEIADGKTMYSASSDFPLIGQRLLEVQSYMNAQNPSDLTTLWYDRRDILRFYTFWAVVVVGSLGILLSAASVALTAVQVYQGTIKGP